MKKSLGLIILVISFVVISLVVVYFTKKNPEAEQIVKSNAPAVSSDARATNQDLTKLDNQTISKNDTGAEDSAQNNQEIQACLGNDFKSVAMSELRDEVLGKFQLPPPQMDQLEFRLNGRNGEDIRIQKNSDVPVNEIVRVYKIDTEGMPDIVLNYPQSDSDDISTKIRGALSLGVLREEIQHFRSQKADTILEYEVIQNKLASVRFSKDKIQLSCDSGLSSTKCVCQKF